MGKRWRPPRWAKPRKLEKDPELEEAIRQILIDRNRAKARKQKEEESEHYPVSGNE